MPRSLALAFVPIMHECPNGVIRLRLQHRMDRETGFRSSAAHPASPWILSQSRSAKTRLR